MIEPRRPIAAASLLIVSAVAIVVGVLSKSWWGHRDEWFIGPLGGASCVGGQCDSISWGILVSRGSPSIMPTLGTVTVMACGAAALLASACAVLALARKHMPVTFARHAFTIAIAATVVFATVLVVGKNRVDGGGMGPGWAPIPTFVGLIAGRIALWLVARKPAS